MMFPERINTRLVLQIEILIQKISDEIKQHICLMI